MNISLSAFVPKNFVSQDGFGSPVPHQPAHLHTQAEYDAYLRDSSRAPRRRPFIHFKPPYDIGPVTSLLSHATAYRWRSLLRVRRHRATKPQGSSEQVLPWEVTMDQIKCASLSHTHYWYEVGMLKVHDKLMLKSNPWSQGRKHRRKGKRTMYSTYKKKTSFNKAGMSQICPHFGRGCARIAHLGDIFDQPPGEMS